MEGTASKAARTLLPLLLCAAALLGYSSCSNGSSGDFADDSETRYFGISGGTAGGTASAPSPAVPASSGPAPTDTGGGTTPAPTPVPPAKGVAMKTGPEINAILVSLGANTGSDKSFSASASPPPDGAKKYLLSNVDEDHPTEVWAWAEGSAIKYYAEEYTDSGRKIPLNADSSKMFYLCSGLTSLDVSGFGTGNVTNMESMFYGCRNLTSLDVSGFDTGNVIRMDDMFRACVELTTIYASSGFVTRKVLQSESGSMFWACSKLEGGAGTTYDSNHRGKAYARIDDPANGRPGYFTAKQ